MALFKFVWYKLQKNEMIGVSDSPEIENLKKKGGVKMVWIILKITAWIVSILVSVAVLVGCMAGCMHVFGNTELYFMQALSIIGFMVSGYVLGTGMLEIASG